MTVAACTTREEDLLPVALGAAPADALQEHLSGCASCQERLERLRHESSALRAALKSAASTVPYTPASAGANAERRPGTIGKYFIVGQLGQGAQAITYRAVHPELHREVVLKHAHKKAAGAPSQLLVREGQALARLDHPNIARVCDLDFHDGRPFLVLEYHAGVNLEQYVAGRSLTPRQCAALLVPLARALAAAHRLGIVHQDIKPANILVDPGGKPVLLDFGLARMTDAWSGRAEQPSGGTCAFMSPEQARGDVDRIGPHSDVFGLGAVLYFLLTGQPPFEAADAHEAMKRAAGCDFDRALLERKGPLAALCLRALAPEPADRFRSAEDFAVALESYLGRRRRWLSAAGAAALVLVGLALWRLWPIAPTEAVSQAPILQPLIKTVGRAERGKTPRRKFSDSETLKAGDILTLGYSVPPGHHSALFVVRAQGEVRELGPSSIHRVAGLDEVRYPPEGEADWPVTDAGPLLFLVVASRRAAPTAADLRPLIEEGGLPLPSPPEDYLFYVTRAKVHEEVQPRGGADAYAQLLGRLERLRARAAQQFDHVWGVAVPVR